MVTQSSVGPLASAGALPSPDPAEDLQQAALLLQAGRPAEATPRLRACLAVRPDWSDAWRLLGLALAARGDAAGADEALTQALALEPRSGPAAVALSELRLGGGRLEAALACIAPLAAEPDADLYVLTACADALKALARFEEAAAIYARAVAAAPASAVAEHNHGAILADLEQWEAAEKAIRRALAKGLDAPETWLVLARALVGQGRQAEAETAFVQVLQRRPFDVPAHGELSQLIWMRTEDAGAALSRLDAAIAAYPQIQALRLKKAELLDFTGDFEGAFEAVAPIVARTDAEPMVHVIAARVSMRQNPERALRHAAIAAARLSENPVAQGALCEAHLARGEAREALRIAQALVARDPDDQHSLALLATCWRLLDDPAYPSLYDYDRLVAPGVIATPPGWPDLASFLAALADGLGRLHRFKTHPVGQSVRHGSQTTQDLTLVRDPVIEAFFRAIDAPIRAHLAALGQGDDPVRRRNRGDYRFNGAWSVRLRPGGFHADHVHPRGWLSSVFYVSLPPAIGTERQGWLRFGEPGIVTAPHLAAQRFIRPEPGLLALFPSYMWHGTVPFEGDGSRLTIAFDVVPEPIA